MDRRAYQISVFDDTMRRISESETLTVAQEQSIDRQYFVPEDEVITLPSPRFDTPATIHVSRLRTFEAAARYPGKKVAVLNFASAANPGGGVTHGASAQEECLCRCSTLYNCLNTKKMWDAFYTPHRKNHNPLHNDDIIYTPGVTVIKDDDYNLLEQAFAVDVITCAAPNLRECPYVPIQALHEQRARKILSIGAKEEADILILGAFGCGAFCNDPSIVAEAYKKVLPEYMHHFRTIEFAVYCRPGDELNYRAFEEKIGDFA